MKTRPYIIVTPSYCVSAGVRVMHTLCHELNALGFDAKVLLTHNLSPSPEQLLNPALNTPCINSQFEQLWPTLNDDAIVICADGFRGHPFGAKRVVRYVLGKEVARLDDNPADYKVYYSKAFPADKAGGHRVLFRLNADLADFNSNGVDDRTQDMLWLGKGAKFCVERPANCVDISYTWPPSRKELAQQLKKTRYLYSYDTLSATNSEAILCGAIVILKHMSYHDWDWTRQDLELMEHGSGGYAFGDSEFEIDRALRTRSEAVERLRHHNANYRNTLLAFVGDTQRHFRG